MRAGISGERLKKSGCRCESCSWERFTTRGAMRRAAGGGDFRARWADSAALDRTPALCHTCPRVTRRGRRQRMEAQRRRRRWIRRL